MVVVVVMKDEMCSLMGFISIFKFEGSSEIFVLEDVFGCLVKFLLVL